MKLSDFKKKYTNRKVKKTFSSVKDTKKPDDIARATIESGTREFIKYEDD